MKIVTAANLGLAILPGCTLGMGVVGWYGRLPICSPIVLGAAWQTADGAMEGSIELGNQQLYIQKMQNGAPLNRAELDAAKAATDDALARVNQGQLTTENSQYTASASAGMQQVVQEAQECLRLASSLHQVSRLQQRLLSQFRV